MPSDDSRSPIGQRAGRRAAGWPGNRLETLDDLGQRHRDPVQLRPGLPIDETQEIDPRRTRRVAAGRASTAALTPSGSIIGGCFERGDRSSVLTRRTAAASIVNAASADRRTIRAQCAEPAPRGRTPRGRRAHDSARRPTPARRLARRSATPCPPRSNATATTSSPRAAAAVIVAASELRSPKYPTTMRSVNRV